MNDPRARGRLDLEVLRAVADSIRPRAEWAAEQQSYTSYQALDAQWREDGQRLRMRHRRHERGRQDHRRKWLRERRQELARSLSVEDMLRDLSTEQGLSWVAMSRMLGVSVPALRKWRRAGGVTPDNRDNLAGLVAFLRILGEAGVADPAQWISLPVLDGYTVTPLDLYTPLTAVDLLELGAGDEQPATLLERLLPEWRSTHKSEYEVFIAEDGRPSLRPRS